MAVKWRTRGHMLEFTSLDNKSANVAAVYAIGWRFKDANNDPWTKRFFSFKEKNPSAIRGACLVVPKALASLGLSYSNVMVVSAISSSETHLLDTEPLCKLGDAIGHIRGWSWRPDVLQKTKHTSLSRTQGVAGEKAQRRDDAVAGAYTVAVMPVGHDAIIIIDDFCTRCSTISDAARALRRHQGSIPIFGAVLAKNERKSYMAGLGTNIDNSHIPGPFMTEWDLA